MSDSNYIQPDCRRDSRGEFRPQPIGYATNRSVWFHLPRIAKPSHLRAGQWIYVLRTHPATPKRIRQIAQWKLAQSQPVHPEPMPAPSELDLAIQYLIAQDWRIVPNAPYSQFVDPISGEVVPYLEACERQAKRETRDFLAEKPELMNNELKLAQDFDEETRVYMLLGERLAQNTDGTMYLKRSNGHRRSGRPAYYWLHRPNEMAKRIIAWDDTEALEIANALAAASMMAGQSEVEA